VLPVRRHAHGDVGHESGLRQTITGEVIAAIWNSLHIEDVDGQD
jgi:hypothetical protein